MSDVMAVSASGGSTPAESASKKTAKTTGKDFKETLAKVSGHKYAEIKNGDRKGMFVNQSGNGRDGDAFKLVERDGHVFHVYGEGKDRKVFEVPVVDKK
jgi:Cys-tRNA synthase (O-phospho-L-seryl-tRNA:Cys-tRNA synthase)